MDLYTLNKILSNKTRVELIIHFWNCNCGNHDVNYMAKKLGVSQSSISKNINMLLENNIFEYEKLGKNKFYKIDKNFRKEYKGIIDETIKKWNMSHIQCSCVMKNDY